ncbi:MAG TPA: PDZ domain-containing protein, partial [Thermoanaerobaculia bacterium]|nr:PDZ domain-containing protein [Thermoanaerobaculia bacterium]
MNALALPSLRRLAGLLASAAVLALFLLQLWELKESSGRRVGVILDDADQGFQVTEVLPGLPAEQAGLQAGDLVLAIGGLEMRELPDYDLAAARFEPGETVVYRVRRGEEELEVGIRPGTPMEWGEIALTALVLLAYLAIAWLVREQAESDLRARLLRLFTLAVAL